MNQRTLDKIRARIAALQSEREQTRSAARATSEVAADVSAQVEAWHAEGAAALALNHQILSMPTGRLENPFNLPPTFDGKVDLAPLLVALLGKEVVTKALLAGNEAAVAAAGITAADRADRLAAIDAELEALQWDEAELVLQLDVDPRPDSDVRYFIMEREHAGA